MKFCVRRGGFNGGRQISSPKSPNLVAAKRFGQIDQIHKQKVEKGKSLENSR